MLSFGLKLLDSLRFGNKKKKKNHRIFRINFQTFPIILTKTLGNMKIMWLCDFHCNFKDCTVRDIVNQTSPVLYGSKYVPYVAIW